MKYSIVIPTYNNCEKYLKPCIDSIIKYTNLNDIEIIIVANGCTDNTKLYLNYLHSVFPHIATIWEDKPLGFAKACNLGIKQALRYLPNKIILLNNDTILLDQPKNRWLKWLDKGDVNYVLEHYSPITQRQFGIFFIAMINKKVFETIGLLNEDYQTGGCEDIEFCYLAQNAGFTLNKCDNNGTYPIYHVAEGTMHDPALVQNWKQKFHANELKLSKKYNIEYYKYLLSNNYERAVFLKNDLIFPRERLRYEWANNHLYGKTVFELGCTTGYGSQFFLSEIEYTGLDYDPIIIEVAKDQHWGSYTHFVNADINTYDLGFYDTIVAFEVIEHLDNGLEIVEKLKQHCKRLLISVPWNEPKGFWGEHHRLHGLNESHFPDFTFGYVNHAGEYSLEPQPIDANNPSNLMLCKYSAQ